MKLGTLVGLGPDDIVLDEDPAPLPKKGGGALLPNFRPMSIVAKWLDGSRRHLARRWALVQATLLDGDPAPYPKSGGAPPIFGPRLLWPNGCMDQDATTEVGLGLRDIVLYGDPVPLP